MTQHLHKRKETRKMTKEELAAKLNGREYPFEMNVGEITEAKFAQPAKED